MGYAKGECSTALERGLASEARSSAHSPSPCRWTAMLQAPGFVAKTALKESEIDLFTLLVFLFWLILSV